MLSAVITGGFVLIFVEVGNRKNRENDKYRQLMIPFFRKLSAYFKYITWVCNDIVIHDLKSEEENQFKTFLCDTIGRYGRDLIMMGGDYDIDSFTAKQLERIGNNINDIWYMYDKWDLSNLRLDDNVVRNKTLIDKELVKINHYYTEIVDDVAKIAKISGEFYAESYLLIQDEPYYHQKMIKLYHKHSICIFASLLFVLMMFCCMICLLLPIWLLKLLVVVIVCMFVMCLMFLIVDEQKQLSYIYKVRESQKKCWNCVSKLIKKLQC